MDYRFPITSSTGPFAGSATRTGADSTSPSCGIALPLAEIRATSSTSCSCESVRVGIGLSPSSRLAVNGNSDTASHKATDTYTVGAGDSLSGIAAAHDVPGGWLHLYDVNRQAIGDDPNLIKPGQIINLG